MVLSVLGGGKGLVAAHLQASEANGALVVCINEDSSLENENSSLEK